MGFGYIGRSLLVIILSIIISMMVLLLAGHLW
jgi:hypothetical protein